MKRLIVVFLACSWGISWVHDCRGQEHPNVLFIGVDDLNDWIGVLGGHPQSETPNIDRLCDRGVLFTHAYCAAPACNPSRAALMTGVLPSTSGVYHNHQPWREPLAAAVTLPRHYRNHGYWVGGAGKMYHGAFPDPDSWQVYFPSLQRQRPADPSPRRRPINGIKNTAHFDWGPLAATTAEMSDSQVTQWVCERLGVEHQKPFFLACGIYRPHLPWYVPQEYFDRFPLESIVLPEVPDGDLEDIPAAGVRMAKPNGDHRKVLAHDQWPQAVQGYLASVAFADDMIGQLLDTLDRSAYAENTIIVFWTDHGWHLGEKQHWRKFALWEEATRTPLAIVVPERVSDRLPQGATAGRRCDQPVNLTDIYPTLVELCGLESLDQLDGQSLLPLLADPDADWERPALTTHGRGNHALRTPRYRYIRYADGSEELYDHQTDPGEFTNLAGQAEYRSVRQDMAQWLPETNAPDAPRR